MEAKHTKGPWRRGRSGSVVSDAHVEGMSGANEPEYYGGNIVAESVAEQNADLISAGPDLYEALGNLLPCLESMEHPSPWLAGQLMLARAAIAKAEGR